MELHRASTGMLVILQLNNANVMLSVSHVPTGCLELYVPWQCSAQKTNLLLRNPKSCKPSLGLPEPSLLLSRADVANALAGGSWSPGMAQLLVSVGSGTAGDCLP